MAQPKDIQNLIYDIALSSVVPASITGGDKTHDFTNMDLAMKLHYIKGVYLFQESDFIKGLTISQLKLPMFKLLEIYYPLSGRVRRDEDDDGRPFIKCNDSGVRIVEAKCSKTVEQFLRLSLNDAVVYDQLAYDQVLGPDLGFSPLVFVQFTRFACGGMSVGLSWSHAIGDAFSASNFMIMWGQMLTSQNQMQPNSIFASTKSKFLNPQLVRNKSIPFSMKKIESVGDKWSISNKSKMQKHSFHICSKKMNHLLSKIIEKSSSSDEIDPFEVISAVFWKSLAKVRGETEPNIVILCKKGSNISRKKVPISNSQIISIVKPANSSKIAETDVLELVKIMARKSVDETDLIEEMVGEKRGGDFIVYGTKLTFVSLEELDIYGLELKGNKPKFGYYSFDGVGDEGVVLVLPGVGNNLEEDGNGRIVNVILPEDQLGGLKDELLKEWDIC